MAKHEIKTPEGQRLEIATKLLAGLLANPKITKGLDEIRMCDTDKGVEYYTNLAYQYTDELLRRQ